MAEGHPKFPRLFKQLTRRVVIGILITGVIASLSTVVPLYSYQQKSTDSLALAYANAQAIAVQQQLNHYSAIAEQLSSRSYIRNLLSQYRQNELSREQLSFESQKRLADAAELIPELVVGFRLDRNNQPIAVFTGPSDALTVLPEQVNFQLSAKKPLYYVALPLETRPEQTRIYISATAPIYESDTQTLLGVDILLFSSDAVLNILHSLNQFGPRTEFQLVNTYERIYLQFNPQTSQLEYHQLPDHRTIRIAGYGNRPFVFQEEGRSGDMLSHYFVPFTDSQWGLIAVAPNQVFNHGMQSGVFWVLGAILLTAVLGAYLIRQWLRPIIQTQVARAEQLHSSNNQLKLANTVFEKTHEAIVITDAKLTIIRANKAAARLFDTELANLKGQPLLEFVDQDKVTQAVRDDVTQHIRQYESWQGEVWYIRPSGVKFPALQTISPVRNRGGIAMQLIHIFNDISNEKTAQKRIETLAMTDALTHLPNRFAVLHLLNEVISRAHLNHDDDFAVLFVDLDKFKPVNDTYGHAVGDALLQAIGPRMKEALRVNDVIGRLGGDEFVILIYQVTQLDNVKAIAEKVLNALAKPFRIGELTLQIGASVGIALYPRNGTNASALLSAADNAMYKAKQNGRQCYYVADVLTGSNEPNGITDK